MKPHVTADIVRRLFDYDPHSGLFIRKESARPRRWGGANAGHLRRDGYVTIVCEGRKFLAHRLAWLWFYGVWPRKHLDHVNRVKNDNRIDNLREVTPAQNRQNSTVSGKSLSGHRGVCWHKKTSRWRARAIIDGRRVDLGEFENVSDAVAARVDAELKHYTHSPLHNQN